MTEKEVHSTHSPISMSKDAPPNLGEVLLEREIPSDEALIIPLVVRLMDFFIKEGIVTEDDRNRVGLCFEEAISNAVVHGNARNFKKLVRVKVYMDDARWSLSVEDDGAGFDLKGVPNPVSDDAIWGEGGRGLSLMALYMDQVAYYRGGRTLVLSRNL